MDRARKKLLYPLLTQRWFNNCLLIKKNPLTANILCNESEIRNVDKNVHVTYDILYVSIKRTHQLFTLICVNCHYTLQHDTLMSSYYNDEYRNHLTNHSSLVCLKHVFGYHSWPVASPIKRRSLWTIDQAAMTANTSAGALA